MAGKRKKKKSGWLHRWRKRLRKRTRRPRHLLIYVLARIIFAIMNLLPIDTAIHIGGRMGRLAFWLMPHLRHQTRRNLNLVMGSRLSAAECEVIARNVFENAGRGLAEMMTFHRWTDARINERITFNGAKTLPEHQAEHPAVMVIGAHFGSWEFGTVYAGRIWGTKTVAVVRDLSNQWIEQWLRRWRSHVGMEILHRGQAGIGLFRRVKEGRVLVMLVDQFIDGPGLELPFLGRPAHTFLGPAIIAQRLKARVLTTFAYRQANGLNHVWVLDELPLPPMDALSADEQVAAIARAMNDAISDRILRDPGEWMWFHERWRRAKKKHRKAGS